MKHRAWSSRVYDSRAAALFRIPHLFKVAAANVDALVPDAVHARQVQLRLEQTHRVALHVAATGAARRLVAAAHAHCHRHLHRRRQHRGQRGHVELGLARLSGRSRSRIAPRHGVAATAAVRAARLPTTAAVAEPPGRAAVVIVLTGRARRVAAKPTVAGRLAAAAGGGGGAARCEHLHRNGRAQGPRLHGDGDARYGGGVAQGGGVHRAAECRESAASRGGCCWLLLRLLLLLLRRRRLI